MGLKATEFQIMIMNDLFRKPCLLFHRVVFKELPVCCLLIYPDKPISNKFYAEGIG